SEGGIQTAATLFDEGEVKAGSEGDGLQMRGDALGVVVLDEAAVGIGVGARDGRMASLVQAGNSLDKGGMRIDVGVGDTAVTRPEAGVDGELGEVGEAAHLAGAIRSAAG